MMVQKNLLYGTMIYEIHSNLARCNEKKRELHFQEAINSSRRDVRFGSDGCGRYFVVYERPALDNGRSDVRIDDVLALRLELVDEVLCVLLAAAQFQRFARPIRLPAFGHFLV